MKIIIGHLKENITYYFQRIKNIKVFSEIYSKDQSFLKKNKKNPKSIILVTFT